MKRCVYLGLICAGLLSVGCSKGKKDDSIVFQKYVHKYGYPVSKEEFIKTKCPGQLVTLMSNGVTVTATYEDGLLQTLVHTYPNSSSTQSFHAYSGTEVVKETLYDEKGMPTREETRVAPDRVVVTMWYKDGSPLSVEEYRQKELIEGQYFSPANTLESRVSKGKGERIGRDTEGTLLYRDEIVNGYQTLRENFYTNGSPQSIATYKKGRLSGEYKEFTPSGEPLSVKEYIEGELNGKAVFFRNGHKSSEAHYVNGLKNGVEIQYIDGETISQEITWKNDVMQGPKKYYSDGVAKIVYYFEGEVVSEETYKQLSHLDDMINPVIPNYES